MKKILTIFIILDLIFVGIIFKITTQKSRNIASEEDLSPGQKQKLEVIESLKLQQGDDSLDLKTDMLQALCANYSLIQLKFKAVNMAFSGQEPLVTNTFSCAQISKNTDRSTLLTKFSDFRSLQTNSEISNEDSQLKAHALYKDEDMPSDWRLFEIAVTGETSFNISEPEINAILGDNSFHFKIK